MFSLTSSGNLRLSKDFKEPLFSVDKSTYTIKGNPLHELFDFLEYKEVFLSIMWHFSVDDVT